MRIKFLAKRNCAQLSERIAYREVESKRLAEVRHIVVAAMPGIVWRMDAYAEVAANDKHADVEAQSYAGAKCYVAQECRSQNTAVPE